MKIYPAIDVKDGHCVRLSQGNFDKVIKYSDDPVEIGLKWEEAGAEYLHVIDLDGARTGVPQNISIISELAVKLGIPIQLGGGIRTLETVEIILCKGVQRVILGTSAVRNPKFVKEALKNFASSIVIGIDAKDGIVAIEGWAKVSEFTAHGFAKKMEDLGAQTIIYTDIARDGMLNGPNLHAMEAMTRDVSVDIIASGGVSCIDDIKNLKEIGVSGVIVGKALYTEDVILKEAIEVAR